MIFAANQHAVLIPRGPPTKPRHSLTAECRVSCLNERHRVPIVTTGNQHSGTVRCGRERGRGRAPGACRTMPPRPPVRPGFASASRPVKAANNAIASRQITSRVTKQTANTGAVAKLVVSFRLTRRLSRSSRIRGMIVTLSLSSTDRGKG